MVYCLFQVSTRGLVLPVLVRVAGITLEAFVQHICLVQAHAALLQFFEVSNVVQALKHIVFELAHVSLLLVADFSQVFQFALQSLLAQD